MEDRGIPDVMTSPEGEDIFLGDLMVGIDTLPRRQRQAFELICLQGYTETAARDELLPNSVSSTPVQQYADSALVRMVSAYDAKQRGFWFPPWLTTSTSRIQWRKIMTTLHPVVKSSLEGLRKRIQADIASLQQALEQVEGMLALSPNTAPAAAKPEPKTPTTKPAEPKPEPKAETPESPKTEPAPIAKPEGKPSLQEMARDLANAH